MPITIEPDNSRLELIEFISSLQVIPGTNSLELQDDEILLVFEEVKTEYLVVGESITVLEFNEPQIEVLTVAEQGLPGLSAYQVALKNGFQGTEAEWLLSLNANGLDIGDVNTDFVAIFNNRLNQ